MRVRNSIFYHIHTPESGVPALEVGKEYVSGNQPNRFWQFYLDHSFKCEINPYAGDYPVLALQHHVNSSQLENHELNKSMLNYSSSVLFECGMLIREMMFEEIRLREFPNVPSRRTALYLTDSNGLSYWLKWFAGFPAPKYIYRVQCTGVVHQGSQKFLDSDISNYISYTNDARSYWSGEGVEGQLNTEFLFHGKWQVLEQM